MAEALLAAAFLLLAAWIGLRCGRRTTTLTVAGWPAPVARGDRLLVNGAPAVVVAVSGTSCTVRYRR